jgi:hypothetical protein
LVSLHVIRSDDAQSAPLPVLLRMDASAARILDLRRR